MSRSATVTRETRETSITITVDFDGDSRAIETGLPFFDHMLTACSFHGGFGLAVRARGDLEVDPHHVVEDTGIVLGTCLGKVLETGSPVRRFGHAVIPMDEALSEAVVDVCGRPTLVYTADYPQPYAGDFPLWLFREFFSGLTMGARIALHLHCRYGENSHHMVEALCKALGRAIGHAYAPVGETAAKRGMSTKGTI